MSSKVVRESVDALLLRIAEFEAAVRECDGDPDALSARARAYLGALSDLRAQRDALVAGGGAPTEVAVEMLQAVDDGENPDAVTEDIFRSSLAANQAAKGKAVAFGRLADALADQLRERLPEEQLAYERLRAPPSAEVAPAAAQAVPDQTTQTT